MKLGLSLFILYTGLASIALAANSQGKAIGQTCSSAIKNITFECKPRSKCKCNYAPTRQTIINCIEEIAKNKKETKAAMKAAFGKCSSLSPETLKKDKAAAKKNVRTVSIEELRNSVIDFPIVLPKENIDYAQFCVEKAASSYDTATTLISGILGYWALVMVLKSVSHLTMKIVPRIIFAFDNSFSRGLKRHALMPATFRYSHSSAKKFLGFTFAIPTRLQTFIVLGYGIVNIILLFTNFPYVKDSWYYDSNTDQIRVFLAWRTGIFAFAHIPLLFLFAGRNNFLIWLTGWPLDTFNVFHRWVGRGMLGNAIIHAVIYSVRFMLRGAMKARWKFEYIQYGFVAIASAALMVIFGSHVIRSHWYETFLISHILLAIAFTVGTYYHAFYRKGSQEYIYAAIAVWAFDRVLRVARIILSGLNSSCEVELFRDGIIKMKVSYSRLWKIRPGKYAFIQILGPKYFWQSHPFTITSSCVPEDEGKFILLIKSKDGFTRQLREELEKTTLKRKQLPVLVDGPYGTTNPVDQYDNILLIAGGIGVTGVYSYATALRAQKNDKRIVFVWCIADDRPLEWFGQELEYLANDPRFDVRVHMKGKNKELTEERSGTATPTTLKSSQIQYTSDRFPAITVLDEEIANATRSTAVVCCGPPNLNDDVRYSVSRNLLKSKARVDYYEESFSW